MQGCQMNWLLIVTSASGHCAAQSAQGVTGPKDLSNTSCSDLTTTIISHLFSKKSNFNEVDTSLDTPSSLCAVQVRDNPCDVASQVLSKFTTPSSVCISNFLLKSRPVLRMRIMNAKILTINFRWKRTQQWDLERASFAYLRI